MSTSESSPTCKRKDRTTVDYGRVDNLDKVSHGFQPANTMLFEIKNSVMMNLKSNQFSSKETEDCNAHLTHFMDAHCKILGAEEGDFQLKAT